jgi:hypothetical protein
MIELITKFVLLAIALIGLYKVWHFEGGKPAVDKTNTDKPQSNSSLSDMVEMYAIMFLPILFVGGMFFLMNFFSFPDKGNTPIFRGLQK